MFSGIIEAIEPVQKFAAGESALRVHIRRPAHFDDLKKGDSIAVNGVCLTLEDQNAEALIFALGAETLKILNLNLSEVNQADFPWRRSPVNLERSLRFGDRMHGHFVTGHVDALAEVVDHRVEGECLNLTLKVAESKEGSIWKKGSVTLNGVSLTVNAVRKEGSQLFFEVCLIPETLARTNLRDCKVGHKVNLEYDWMAKGLMLALQNRLPEVST